MTIQDAPESYTRGAWQQIINTIRARFQNSYRKDQHIDINPATYVIMTSPDGTRFSVTVSNAGALVVTSL